MSHIVPEARDILLFASQPDVVGYESVVIPPGTDIADAAETILQIVSARRVEFQSIDIEPCRPERPFDRSNMSTLEPGCVISAHYVQGICYVEVYYTDETVWGEHCHTRVDYGIAVWH